MTQQDLLTALGTIDYYRNLSDKDFFDNLDTLADYFNHTFAKTKETKKIILDMISGVEYQSNGIHDYRISQLDFFKANKKFYDNTSLYHGLNAYKTNLTDTSLSVTERIRDNLANIVTNKEIELATSSTHMIGDIGIKGKGDTLFASPWDMYSVVDKETGVRSKPKSTSILTDSDIFSIIDKYEKNPTGLKTWSEHDEVIAKSFEIDSLWVKKSFYDEHQDFVLGLLKENKIQNLDIVHSDAFKQKPDANNVTIERIKTTDLVERAKQVKPIEVEAPVEQVKPIDTSQQILENKSEIESSKKISTQVTSDATEQVIKENVEQSTKKATIKAAGGLPRKSLGGNGKLAIGIAAASLVMSGIAASKSSSKKKSKNESQFSTQLHAMTNSQQHIDNSYAAQMAQDISSYRYGKHMTGFVNY